MPETWPFSITASICTLLLDPAVSKGPEDRARRVYVREEGQKIFLPQRPYIFEAKVLGLSCSWNSLFCGVKVRMWPRWLSLTSYIMAP